MIICCCGETIGSVKGKAENAFFAVLGPLEQEIRFLNSSCLLILFDTWVCLLD